MKLFDRIAVLIKADAHGVIESIEERSLLLKQYLREAEIEVNRKHARLEAVREEEKRLRETLARHEDEVRSLDEDIQLAMAGGKEDLARFAIRRLIPRREDVKALRAQIEQRDAEAQSLTERLATQQTQLEGLRARVRAELNREAEPGSAGWPAVAAVANEEVELELLRRRQSKGGLP
jgi:phage shock protein A